MHAGVQLSSRREDNNEHQRAQFIFDNYVVESAAMHCLSLSPFFLTENLVFEQDRSTGIEIGVQ